MTSSVPIQCLFFNSGCFALLRLLSTALPVGDVVLLEGKLRTTTRNRKAPTIRRYCNNEDVTRLQSMDSRGGLSCWYSGVKAFSPGMEIA